MSGKNIRRAHVTMAIVLFSCGEEASGVVGGKVIMEVCLDNVLAYIP